MPDLVYVVRPGGNEELRYSLRSAVNLPHENVWVVGSCPGWARGVRKLLLKPQPEKWANIRQSLTAAAACDEIADDVVLMCDDFFTLRPLDEIPMFHLGSLCEYAARVRTQGATNTWRMGVQEMYEQMVAWGYPDALSYEGHMPMPFSRRRLGELLADSTCRFLWGCAYSATCGPAGVKGVNTKVGTPEREPFVKRLAELDATGVPFLSTNETSFEGAVGDHIRSLFPGPGPYEEAS